MKLEDAVKVVTKQTIPMLRATGGAGHADAAETVVAEVKALRKKYDDLILQVARKFPGETRHQTAKRYIVEAETPKDTAARAALSGRDEDRCYHCGHTPASGGCEICQPGRGEMLCPACGKPWGPNHPCGDLGIEPVRRGEEGR